MKRNIAFSLIAINAALAVVLGWQWFSPAGQRDTQWAPPAPIKPQLNSSPSSVTSINAPVGGLAAMQDRPIFSATRRPVSAVSALVVTRADPMDSVRLYGVIAGSDGGGVIVGVEGKTRRLKVSDVLGEWRLNKVRDKEAVFARGADTRVLSLVQTKQAQSAPPPVAQPPAVQQFPAAVPSRPVASSAKPAPGFLIGGSR